MSDLKRYLAPYLQVEHKEVSEEIKWKNVDFKLEDVRPKTGGPAGRLHENVVEYFVCQMVDEPLFADGKIPPIMKLKFVKYVRTDYVGAVKIELQIGHHERKATDWRFYSEKITHKDSCLLVYDYDEKQWKTVDSKKEEWGAAMIRHEELQQEAMSFIRTYLHEKQNQMWIRNKEGVGEQAKFVDRFHPVIQNLHENGDFHQVLDRFEAFLEKTDTYLTYLALFGDIDREEYEALQKALSENGSKIEQARSHLNEHYSTDMPKNERITFIATSPYGICYYAIQELLTPRPEKKITQNFNTGYIRIDHENKKLYPNVGEVERRRYNTEKGHNEDSEQEIHELLFKAAANKK